MSTNSLRWVGIVLPLLFWATVVVMRSYLAPYTTVIVETTIELILVVAGGAIFSKWVADRFDAHEAEITQRTHQLEALRQAALAVTTEVELGSVLQRVVELSRELSGARYAALGVLDPSGSRIEQLLTSGISTEERALLGEPPHGHGLLGAILSERHAMRVDSIDDDPRSVGSPPGHPHMSTLLGVPLQSKGKLFGNLYLTDKQKPDTPEPAPFTEQDQRTLEMFAAHAAVAIENARLHRQSQQVAVMQERERFGMNLHDGIIQSIYAIGLLLDDAHHRAESEPTLAQERLAQAIAGLNDVIKDIRSYIMDLRPQHFEGRTLEEGLQELAGKVNTAARAAGTPLHIDLQIHPGAAALASAQQTDELLHVAQEALANIQKHSGAGEVKLKLTCTGDRLEMVIADDGRGFDVFRAATRSTGNGLRNMQERTRSLDGDFEIESASGKGTRIVLSLPLNGDS